MLKLVDRNKITGRGIYKRTIPGGKCVGYVIGKMKNGKLISTSGARTTLGAAREAAAIPYSPPVKETMTEKEHALRQAQGRSRKPKKGK